jgi:hypothetical protein
MLAAESGLREKAPAGGQAQIASLEKDAAQGQPVLPASEDGSVAIVYSTALAITRKGAGHDRRRVQRDFAIADRR